MVNPHVDDYTQTLNQRKILHGVLLTLNQLNMVLKLELFLFRKKFFSQHNVFAQNATPLFKG